MTKILVDKAVIEQALKALSATMATHGKREWIEAAKQQADAALRSALDQPQVEQHPVAVVTGFYGGFPTIRPLEPVTVLPAGMALYTHPQNLNCKSNQARLATLWGYEKSQPPRQPLTDEQIARAWAVASGEHNASSSVKRRITRAIERAHGIGGEA